jgi:hypothetical protein
LKKRSFNRKDAKYAKKKYNLSIAGFTPIKQKKFYGAGSNRKSFQPDGKFKLCGRAQ